jgi:hypothetical protein
MRLLRERSNFAVPFVGTLALILGLVSALLTLLGTHFTVRTACAYVLMSAIAAAIIHRNRLRTTQIPPDILPTTEDQVQSKICCPCTMALSKEVFGLARSCFGSDTISLERYEQLRVKNPYILACLLSSTGRFLGYFDIVPIDESFGSMFINGKLGEKDLTHEHVIEPSAMAKSKFVYLSGIAAANVSSMSGMQNASILVWASFKYLEHFYGSSSPIAFASAVTAEGENLLRRLGFELHSRGDTRTDGHSLYCIVLSYDQIRLRLRRLPDYAGIVELPWNTPRAVPAKTSRSHRGVPPIQSQHEWSATGTDVGLRRIK